MACLKFKGFQGLFRVRRKVGLRVSLRLLRMV